MKSKPAANIPEDTISLHELEVSAAIGILPFEKSNRQTLLIDCSFTTDAAHIAKTDAIQDATDYAAVREAIISFAEQHRINLIETFSHQLALFLLESFSLNHIQLTVKKPTIFPDAKGVSICVYRSR